MVAEMVKNLSAMQETWVQSLGQEDPLEQEMAVHSGVLAWRIPWTRAWWAAVYGVAQSWTRLKLLSSMHICIDFYMHLFIVYIKIY